MVEVRGLSRYYGTFQALSDVSFDLAEGEIVGLLGLNGAGKSTTLKVLAGLLAPSAGSVRIGGRELTTSADAHSSTIGYLPEEPPLYVDMTVTDFLTHVGRLKAMAPAAIASRLPEVIRTTQLEGREHQVIRTLSHGYRKRVGIAQAILHDPKLVILDEPISGLDPAQIVEMRRVVRSLGQGRSVILSSHILGEISMTCDRILVVHRGRVVAQGTETELGAGRQGTRVRVVTRGGPALLPWLRAAPGVTAATGIDTNDDTSAADVTLAADSREQLVAALVQAGFGVRNVLTPEDELEGIFLGLTHSGADA